MSTKRVVVWVLLLGLGVLVSSAGGDAFKTRQDKEQSDLQAKVTLLSGQVEKLGREARLLRNENETLRKELGRIAKENLALRAQVASSQPDPQPEGR